MKPFCAMCLAYGPALRPRQLVDHGPLFLLCAGCDVSEPRRIPNYGRYTPFDTVERNISNRILRAVRRFDWITSMDLAEVLAIPAVAADRTAHNNYSVALSRLARTGYLRRRREAGMTWYQITPLGRRRIGTVEARP